MSSLGNLISSSQLLFSEVPGTLFSHLAHLAASRLIKRCVFQMNHSALKYSENLHETNYASCLEINSIGGVLTCWGHFSFLFFLFFFFLNYLRKEKDFTMCSKLIKTCRGLGIRCRALSKAGSYKAQKHFCTYIWLF